MKLARGLGPWIAIAGLVVALDQASKLSLRAMFGESGPPPELRLPPVRREGPFLDLVMTWNRGISFGLGNTDGVWNALIFGVLALVIAAVMLWWMSRVGGLVARAGLALVIGGAIGNVIDRIVFGAVEDFIYVHVGAFDWWPAFNLADSAICVGAGLLVIDSLFLHRDSPMNSA